MDSSHLQVTRCTTQAGGSVNVLILHPSGCDDRRAALLFEPVSMVTAG